jgi:hypothetical protein
MSELKEQIMHIFCDIDSMQNDKDVVLENAVKERLEESYSSYEDTMKYSLDYLQRKEPIKVMRRINRSEY